MSNLWSRILGTPQRFCVFFYKIIGNKSVNKVILDYLPVIAHNISPPAYAAVPKHSGWSSGVTMN